MVRLARNGQAPATAAAAAAMNDEEAKLALAEYHPFWYVDRDSADDRRSVRRRREGFEGQQRRTCRCGVEAAEGTERRHRCAGRDARDDDASAFDAAVEAAAAWFQKYL